MAIGHDLFVQFFERNSNNRVQIIPTLLKIIDYQIRTSALQESIQQALIKHVQSAALEPFHFEFINELLHYILQSNEPIPTSLFLSLSLFAKSDDNKCRLEVLKFLLNIEEHSFNKEDFMLLKRIYNYDFDSLPKDLHMISPWSDNSKKLLSHFLQFCDSTEMECIIESLSECVCKAEDISTFMIQLKDIDDIGWMLTAHSLLIKYNYPLQETKFFTTELSRRLLKKDEAWMVKNISANCERYLLSCYSKKSIVNLSSILCIISAVTLYPNDSSKRLFAVIGLFFDNIPCNSRGKDVLEALLTVISTSNPYFTHDIFQLWNSVTKKFTEIDEISELLEMMKKYSHSWKILCPPLLLAIDVRKNLFPIVGADALQIISDTLCSLRLVEDPPQTVEEMIDSLYLQISSITKAPFTSANVILVNFASSHYESSLKILAQILILYLNWKKKSWKQILSEYNANSPWLLHGNSIWHRVILPVVYSKWLEYESEIGLFKCNPDLVLQAGLQQLGYNDCGTGEIILKHLTPAASLESDNLTIIKIISEQFLSCLPPSRVNSISSSYCLSVVKSLDNIIRLSRPNSSGLEFLLFVLRSFRISNISINEQILTRICSIVDFFNLEIIILSADYIRKAPSNELVDKFDYMLSRLDDFGCKEALDHLHCVKVCESTLDWVLRRITSVVVALDKNFLGDNRSFVYVLVAHLDIERIVLYLEDLLSLSSVSLAVHEFFTLIFSTILYEHGSKLPPDTILRLFNWAIPSFKGYHFDSVPDYLESPQPLGDREIWLNKRPVNIPATPCVFLLLRAANFHVTLRPLVVAMVDSLYESSDQASIESHLVNVGLIELSSSHPLSKLTCNLI